MGNIEYTKELISLIIATDFSFKDVKRLADIYTKGDEIERGTIRKEIVDTKCSLKILSLSEGLAELAYNEKKHEYIEIALTLHSIEDFSFDPRENIVYLSVIWFVMEYLKVDKTKLFDDVIKISSHKASLYLQEFYSTPPEMKSIKTMGLKAVVKNSKIIFELKAPPWLRNAKV